MADLILKFPMDLRFILQHLAVCIDLTTDYLKLFAIIMEVKYFGKAQTFFEGLTLTVSL